MQQELVWCLLEPCLCKQAAQITYTNLLSQQSQLQLNASQLYVTAVWTYCSRPAGNDIVHRLGHGRAATMTAGHKPQQIQVLFLVLAT